MGKPPPEKEGREGEEGPHQSQESSLKLNQPSNFRTLARRLLTVSREEIMERERRWKAERNGDSK